MKVALSGSHGTGKSTLLAALENQYGNQMAKVPEVARLVCERRKDPTYFQRGQNTPVRQVSVLAHQIACEATARTCELMVTDRSILDSWVYARVLFPEWATGPEGMEVHLLVIDWLHTYDLVLYLPVQFPVSVDGIREEDEAFRDEVDRQLRYEYEKADLPTIELTGDQDTQVKRAVSAIDATRRLP